MKNQTSLIATLAATAIAVMLPAMTSAQSPNGDQRRDDDKRGVQAHQSHQPQQNRPNDNRGTAPSAPIAPSVQSHNARPGPVSQPQRPVSVQQPSRPLPAYTFRGSDRDYLNRHYARSLRQVNVNSRPVFSSGHVLPRNYRTHITPVPAAVVTHLPPVPRGYRVGYVQGYNVVYDPTTFMIISVIDLLTR